MCDILNRVTQYTPALPKVVTLKDLTSGSSKGIKSYNTNGNKDTKSESLLNQAEVAIAKTHIKKGDSFPLHTHLVGYEIIIIITGSLDIIINNETHKLGALDSIKIPVNVPHEAKANSDTCFIAISVPSDEGFPK